MKDDVLVLFSGGKDSFLTAAMLAEKGMSVRLFSCNNGAVAAEENLLHGAKRLQSRYGDQSVVYEGVYHTASIIQRLNRSWMYSSWRDLGEKYPHMINAQIQCLHCQAAMWVAAVAYAKAKGIPTIAAGYHDYDEFCTGCSWFSDCVSGFAKAYGISTRFPVWTESDWKDGWRRDIEMIDRFFDPAVLEPKCMLGMPARKLTDSESSEMMRFFGDWLQPKMKDLVDPLVPTFRAMNLCEKSLI